MDQKVGPVPQYNWKDIPEREMRQGVVQKVFRGDQCVVGQTTLYPGMKSAPHSHEWEQIFMILQGRVKLHVGDQVHDCGPGTVVRIPPHIEHWVEPPAAEDGVAINLDIFSPIRPDFLELTKYQTEKFDE